MKKAIFSAILIVIVSNGMTRSQSVRDEMSDSLAILFGRLRTNSGDDLRLRINDSIKSIIERYVYSDRIFAQRFSNLRYLGQISSSDSLIKIITWNLVLSNEPGRYYCYFIRRSADGRPNTVYKLTSASSEKPINVDTVYTKSDWYGALYYDIKPFRHDSDSCWILLGINFGNPLVTRKIIDVISFATENDIIFGRKWFISDGNIEFRHVFEYSSSGIMSLRFGSDTSIVFDHLVPLPPSENDGHMYYGSDYSFDSFIYRNGSWNLTLNVDVRNKR
jgi:hypothetical protein